MGNCGSHELALAPEQEWDENVVYVMDGDEGAGRRESRSRKLASLFSHRGKKGPNQDSLILCQGFGTDDGLFCGVFDGHGREGHKVSRLARDLLPYMLLSQHNALFIDADDDDDDYKDFSPVGSSSSASSIESPPASPVEFIEWRAACLNAFKLVDDELKLQPGIDGSFSGSTAVCIIKQNKDLIVANLGDSRAVLAKIPQPGEIVAVPLTKDLKPNLPEEAERIRKSDGRVFGIRDEPGVKRVWLPDENSPGLAMSRSFGDFRLKSYGVISTPLITHHRVTGDDFFVVLATDGVWDVLSNEDVVSVVSSAERKEEAARAVVERALQTWRLKFPSSRVDDCSAACIFL